VEFDFQKTFTRVKESITKGVEEMDLGKRFQIVKERLERLRSNNAPNRLIKGEEALLQELERQHREEQEKKKGTA